MSFQKTSLVSGIDVHDGGVVRSILADLALSESSGGGAEPLFHDVRMTFPLCGSELGGKWLLLRELGRGSCAIVLEALDLDQVSDIGPDMTKLLRWALKIVRAGDSDVAEAGMKREAVLLSKLDGLPGMIRVGGVERVDEWVFLRTSIAPGRCLPAILRENPAGRGLPEHSWRSILSRLAFLLHEIHQRGVVHGDVKPGNIIVSLNPAVVTLVDFGSGRVLDGSNPAGTGFGFTPAWARPGRSAAHPPVLADDLYALAVLCCRLIDGRYPCDVPRQEAGRKRYWGRRVFLPWLCGGIRRLWLLVDHVLNGGEAEALDFYRVFAGAADGKRLGVFS